MRTVTTRDGRRLAVEDRGEKVPVVVLEAGMGASHHSWGAVAPAVASVTRTVTYDRAGLGASDPDPAGRGLDRLVDDLLDLLADLGDGPFVLVGHSWGGPVVRVAASRVPDRIAGLVLVDQTDEGCDLYFDPKMDRQQRSWARLLPVLARLGLVRFVIGRARGELPDEAVAAMKAQDGGVDGARGHAAEAVASIDDLRGLRDDRPVLPDVPVTLISGTKRSRFGQAKRDALVAAHRALAESLPQGRHVEAGGSGHLIPLTEPDVVIAEVLRIVRGA